MKVTLLIVTLMIGVISSKTIKRPYIAAIEPSHETSWGSWGSDEFCPEGSYANGFSLKVEEDIENGDDTALNAIKLSCAYHNGTEGGYITSTEQIWGGWTSFQRCYHNEFLHSAQLKTEAYLGPGWDRGYDDTAGNDLDVECTDGELLNGDGDRWGEWSELVSCPSNTAICGINTLVESDQGNDVDDTALNGVKFYCCEL